MKKIISILGSTGSVGQSVEKIIEKKSKSFKIILLSANKNYKLICSQIKKYNPEYFVINNFQIYKKVKKKFTKKKIKIINSFQNIKLKKKKIDITISAIPGIAGLSPTIEMIKPSKKMLIANKEAIICGWGLIKKISTKNKTKIIPIDSEHYSIVHLIKNHNLSEIKKIFITASGGPFVNFNHNKLKKILPKDALKHPKWKMGKKISVDSATLMNKILEIIEAQKLFDLPKSKIDILIHPNSLVNAILILKNGLKKFIYHDTTMIIPIANAIFDEKIDINNFYKTKQKPNKSQIENLIFKKVDEKIFPIFKIVKRVNEHYSTPIIINAANEVLVYKFLNKKIPFLAISRLIKLILNDRNYKKYAIKVPVNLNQIYLINNWAKNKTLELVKKFYE